MPKLKNTLVWKLTTWFLLLSTFPVIVMMVFVRQSIHDTVSDLASENIISQAALLADQISSSGLQGEVKELLSNGSSESQTAFILDQEGKYLLHHDATKRGSSAFDDLPADLVRAILDDGKGAITEEGGNRIVGFSRVASSSSIAVLVSDGSVVSGPMQHLEKSAFFQIMVSLVIVAIAGAAAIWVMFNPIHKLARAAEEVGAGNLDLQVDPSDMEGELAVLTHSFNHMTEQLREAYDELEQRVEARTEELRNSQETERQMAEENALLTEIGRIVSSTLDIDEVYEQFALEMKRLVDFDRMAVNIIDQEAGVFVFKYASGIIQAGRQVPDIVPLANTQTQIVLESGRSLVQTDVTLAPHFSGTSTFLEMGLRSSIMVPLISNGVVTGTLSLRSRKVGAYGDRELSILERLANLVAPAIENAELYSQTRMAEGAMAESEERYRTLFQQSKDAILIASDGKIIEANQAVNEMLGYDADEAIGLDLEKVYVDLEDGSRLQEEISTHGSVKDFEVKLQRRDGSEIDCLVTATNLQTSAGTSLGIQGIIRDVTDRKQNEETLLQQTRELAVLAERNRMAREIHDTLAQGFTGIVLQMEAAEQASSAAHTYAAEDRAVYDRAYGACLEGRGYTIR